MSTNNSDANNNAEDDPNQTIFGMILRGEIPSERVWEDDVCIAFRDINPAAPVHILIIPRKHIATANDIATVDAATVGHMVVTAAAIAKREGIAEDGYRLVINCNQHGGQTVYHLHLHLLGGRRLGWPPG